MLFRVAVDFSSEIVVILNALDVFIWLAFAVEYTLLLSLSPHKVKFIKSHVLDLLIVLIPALRLFRILGVFGLFVESEAAATSLSETVMRVLKIDSKISSVALFMAKALGNIKGYLVRGNVSYVLLFVVFMVIFMGSLVVYAEKNAPNANIMSIYDGIWWSIASITTVGYGDRYPVTLAGRVIGVLLMTIGITSFSLLTAEIASFLVGQRKNREQAELMNKLEELEEKIDSLK